MFRRLTLAVVIVLLVLLGVSLTSAQEDTPTGSAALAAMLRFVPDNDSARVTLSFADYRAAEEGRDLLPFDSFSLFENSGREIASFWMAAMPSAGMPLQFFTQFDVMPDALGIDFFDIDQTLTWGYPPDGGLILRGDFDEESIRAAHAARGFVESALNETPLWCSADGCDAGRQMNPADRQLADLFGGDLGRRFPRALAGDMFFGSGSDVSVAAMQAAGVTGVGSLADQPAYQAVVAALDGDHYLRGVLFALPNDFFDFDPSVITPDMSEAQMSELQDQLRGGQENLPVYNLAAFADIAAEDAELAQIALVYRDAEVANAAAVVLPERLANAVSAVTGGAWADLIADRGGEIVGVEVVEVETAERAVLLLTLSKPLPTNPLFAQDQPLEQSGLLFQLLMNGYIRRDLFWLQPVLLY